MACTKKTDDEVFLVDKYCFILRKLYTQVITKNNKINPYTNKKFDDKTIERLISEYTDQSDLHKLHHRLQPLNKTRNLYPKTIVALKLLHFGFKPSQLPTNTPFLLIGTIPRVDKKHETLFASRLGMNPDLIVSPGKDDIVVNMRGYKDKIITCDIWEDCDIPNIKWAGVYFNHIPVSDVKSMVKTIMNMARHLEHGGVLIYQTDIHDKMIPEQVWDKVKQVANHLPGCYIGKSSWNQGSYAWLILRRK